MTAAAVVALAGCSSEPTSSESSVDAAALVQQSSEAMQGLTGAHFVVTAEGKIPNLKVTKLEADVASKPAVAAEGTATVQVGQQTQEAKLIFADGKLYSDIAEPGQWIDYGEGSSIYNLSVLLDPQQGLANALAKLQDPKVEGTEDIDGTATTKITGTASTNAVAELAGAKKAPEKEQTVPMTVWIADDDPHYLVRAEITPVPDTKITMTLSDFGKQVNVSKPI
ncbi:LppX_LprAFG lipoprotein [Mycobacterium adipatum]|uniref:LppX_LprAFG lipoprotein n=1 Tax=Mycobacterium adipatum TaxID=1682113 RepID=UPI0018D40EF1|nr:LppX_LprAFG lipoprotein [Mycobacterium adipatum]